MDNEIEIKDFQDEPNLGLMDDIYNLGKAAVFEYGEKQLGDFLITLALRYKTREYELETRKMMVYRAQALAEMRQAIEDAVEKAESDVLDKIDFSKENVH